MNELINSNVIKMTSIEMAELVGKRHDNVKRTIETLQKQTQASTYRIRRNNLQLYRASVGYPLAARPCEEITCC